MQGQSTAGLAQMQQGMAAVVASGQTLTQPLCLVLLAEAVLHTGQVKAGLQLLAEALPMFETSGRADVLAEAHRLQGELLRQAVPESAQAEVCFQQALTIARRQQAKSWELRAALHGGADIAHIAIGSDHHGFEGRIDVREFPQ